LPQQWIIMDLKGEQPVEAVDCVANAAPCCDTASRHPLAQAGGPAIEERRQ
jgi:hypothetical protein